MPDPIFFYVWRFVARLMQNGMKICARRLENRPRRLQNRPRRLQNRPRRAPKATPETQKSTPETLGGILGFLGRLLGGPRGACCKKMLHFGGPKRGQKVRFFDIVWNSRIFCVFERRKCKNPRVFTLSHLKIKKNHIFKPSQNTRLTSVSPR